MSARAFFNKSAHERTARVVQRIEGQTAAEVVVAVRRQSAPYRETDYLFGFAVALAILCALLFLPQPFDIRLFPLDLLLGFVLGAALSAWAPPLRRWLTRTKTQRQAVRTAAHAAFHELGISRTSGRTGVLVFVSMLERRVHVVPDIGIDTQLLGEDWQHTIRRLQQSIAEGPDLERFLRELESFGPVLGRVLPREEDDVNELPDTVRAA
jgi:putative membrane protein